MRNIEKINEYKQRANKILEHLVETDKINKKDVEELEDIIESFGIVKTPNPYHNFYKKVKKIINTK